MARILRACRSIADLIRGAALARGVSKDGHESMLCGHPSRGSRRDACLGMRLRRFRNRSTTTEYTPMNFDFSDEQKQLRDEARRFLAEKCPPKAVRAVLDGKATYDRELWKGLADMGFLGVAIPEEFGGAGAGHLELCVIAEEMGRCAGAGAVLVDGLSRRGSDPAGRQRRAEAQMAAGDRVGRRDRHAGAVRRQRQSTPQAIKLSASNGRARWRQEAGARWRHRRLRHRRRAHRLDRARNRHLAVPGRSLQRGRRSQGR